jgi:hypothetical protein
MRDLRRSARPRRQGSVVTVEYSTDRAGLDYAAVLLAHDRADHDPGDEDRS